MEVTKKDEIKTAVNEYKNAFVHRNRLVFLMAGLCCIGSCFLDFFSFSYNDWTFILKAPNAVSDVSFLRGQTEINWFTQLLFYFPLYVPILGVFYLIRGVILSYATEKHNSTIYKSVDWLTKTLVGIWLLVAAGVVGLFGVTTWLQIADFFTNNLKAGFYVFFFIEVLRYFLAYDLIEDTELNGALQKIQEGSDGTITEKRDKDPGYFVHDGVRQIGPFSLHELSTYIDRNSFIWKEGTEKWISVLEIVELKEKLALQPPPFVNTAVQPGKPPVFNQENTNIEGQ